MKVLLTGGLGFIGSCLAEHIIDRGYKLHILDLSKDEAKLHNIQGKYALNNIDFVNDDLDSFFKEMQFDVVLHLASFYSTRNVIEDLVKLNNVNILGSARLYEAACKSGVKLFVNTGTGFEYGGYNRPIKEDDIPNPGTYYAASKLASQNCLTALSREYKTTSLITIKIFSPYGPNDSPNKLIPYLVKSIRNKDIIETTKGEQIRDYLYVDDIAEAYIKCVDYINTKSSSIEPESFHIGLGETHTLKEFISTMVRVAGGDEHLIKFGARDYREQDKYYMHYVADINKAINILDWKPVYNINKGIEKLIDFS